MSLSNENQQITATVNRKIVKIIDKLAEKELRTRSQEINYILTEYCNKILNKKDS